MAPVRSRAADRLFSTLVSGRDLELMHQALEARMFWSYKRGEQVTPRVVTRDRLALLGHVLLHPLRWWRAGTRPVTPQFLALDHGATTERAIEVRRYFFETAFGEHVDLIGADARRPVAGRGSWGRYWQVWGRAVRFALRALLDRTPVRLSYIGRGFAHVFDVAVLGDAVERLYVFASYDPIRYFAASYLKDALGVDVWLVAGNSPMYRWMRICHLRAPIVLCSRVQEPELAAFAEEGVNLAGPATYAGNEFALDLVDADRTPKVDLGYFSSGMWARIGGLARTDDIEGIRVGRYADNVYYRRTEEILQTMAQVARERGVRFAIYLHPLERDLIERHGIEPPYSRLADGEQVYLDREPGSSRPRMWEPRVAVSLQSTIVWERLDAGLDATFIYRWDDDPSLNSYDVRVLGPFASATFGSMEELREKLDQALASEETD